jgi:hypothetical protein
LGGVLPEEFAVPVFFGQRVVVFHLVLAGHQANAESVGNLLKTTLHPSARLSSLPSRLLTMVCGIQR